MKLNAVDVLIGRELHLDWRGRILAGAVVIGVGNSFAGDDAAGVLVARALRGRVGDDVALVEHEGEPTALIDLWDGRRLAIVIDAISGAGPPGAIRRFDATAAPVPSAFTGSSTHAFSVGQAIELARALGRLPDRLVVVGIEGIRFEASRTLSPEVAAALKAAVSEVLQLVRTDY